MEILTNIKQAWNGLITNKGRSFLTMLGIIIGVASVIIIISVGSGAQSLIYGQIRRLGSNLIGVLPGKGGDKGPPVAAFGIVITTMKYEDALALQNGPYAVPHLAGLTPIVASQGNVSYKTKTINNAFNGVSASYPNVIERTLQSGRFFNEKEEKDLSKVVVLGSKVAEDLFESNEDPIGKNIKINQEKFRVIGIFSEKGSVAFQNLDEILYIPIITAQKIMLNRNYINRMSIKVDQDKYVDQVMEDIRITLRIRHHIINPDDDDFTVVSSEQALSAISGVTDILKFTLAAVAAISLLVGGIGIMNIMLVVVAERTREIGLRKAIGAKPRHIQKQFLLEAIFITLCGGMIGTIIGIAITTLIAIIIKSLGYDWELSFSFQAILAGLSVASTIGLVFGFYPARKASRLPAIEALRYE